MEEVGSITDIQLASFTSPPEATDSMSVFANLDSEGIDNTPFQFCFRSAWRARGTETLTAATHIGDTAYEYQTSVKVYDSLGSTHDVTVYFDKAAGARQYEYIVVCDPAEDTRIGATGVNLGMLGQGTLDFSSDGVMTNMTFQQNNGAGALSIPALVNQHFTFAPDFLSGTPMAVELNLGSAL